MKIWKVITITPLGTPVSFQTVSREIVENVKRDAMGAKCPFIVTERTLDILV